MFRNLRGIIRGAFRRPVPLAPAPGVAPLAVAAALLLLGVAGCGSQTDSGSGTDGSSGAAATAVQTAATQTTPQVTVESIEADMSMIRNLPLKSPIDVQYLDHSQLQQDMQKEIDREYPPAALDAREKAYKAMGMIKPEVNLRQSLTAMLGQEVAGYYDDETRKLVVVSDQAVLDPMNQVTLSHEVTHALQDQNFDLSRVAPGDTGNDDLDQAEVALPEGDASLAMQQYMEQKLNGLDLLSLGISSLGALGSIGSGPPYLQDSLEFPYTEGLSFVSALYDSGGWNAVDGAYQRPPHSTEQIMHPEKYLADEEPVPVSIPDLSGAGSGGWQTVYETALGEFDLGEMLSQYASSAKARQAAAGWGGGEVRYLEDGSGRRMLVISLNFDSDADTAEFAAAMNACLAGRYNTAFPAGNPSGAYTTPDGVWQLWQSGKWADVVLSPDSNTSQEVIDRVRQSG